MLRNDIKLTRDSSTFSSKTEANILFRKPVPPESPSFLRMPTFSRHSMQGLVRPRRQWRYVDFPYGTIKRLTVLHQLHLKMRAMKAVFTDAWQGTTKATSTGRPMDALVCPVAPSAGIPHDCDIYWGYTCVWNILDYPSTVLLVPGFKISPELDPPDSSYEPIATNPYDKPNQDMCKSCKKATQGR